VPIDSRPQVASLGWALRRAALGLLMLLVLVTLGAWLLYASIDPDEAAAADAIGVAQQQKAAPAR
jgi:hypothetical protein